MASKECLQYVIRFAKANHLTGLNIFKVFPIVNNYVEINCSLYGISKEEMYSLPVPKLNSTALEYYKNNGVKAFWKGYKEWCETSKSKEYDKLF